MTKQNLIELIEDYAAAKVSTRPLLIQGAIMRLNQAVDLMFPNTTEQAGVGNQDGKDINPT